MKRLLWVISVIASLFLCIMAYVLNIENMHYGYDSPGISSDSTLIIFLFSIGAVFASITAIALRHKEKKNLLIPCIVVICVLARIFQIFITASKYS
jgi:uncharacterized transporter YbjL